MRPKLYRNFNRSKQLFLSSLTLTGLLLSNLIEGMRRFAFHSALLPLSQCYGSQKQHCACPHKSYEKLSSLIFLTFCVLPQPESSSALTLIISTPYFWVSFSSLLVLSLLGELDTLAGVHSTVVVVMTHHRIVVICPKLC